MIQYHIFSEMTTRHENWCVMAIDFMISAPKHSKVTKGSGLTVTL